MFSERSDEAAEPNALTRALCARRAGGEAVLDLTSGDPTRAGLPYEIERVAAALARGAREPYAPDSLGLPAARRAIAEPLGLDPDHVLLTASTSEAYAHLFRLLCDPGDEVLVPTPSYPLLAHIARATSVHLAHYPLVWDGRWSIDPIALFDAISPRTRAIVAVSPNNPTGQYLRDDDLAALGALELPLIVDEVFHAYRLEARPDRPRAAHADGGLVFALDGLSKRALLPHLKLAWATVTGRSPLVREAMARLELMADVFLSPSTPVQRALPELLAATASTREAARARCAENLARLRATAAGTALTVPSVEGGWYAPIRVPATRSDEAWALALLEAGVHLHPGYFYDFDPDEAWLVASLLVEPDVFRRGVAVLSELAASA